MRKIKKGENSVCAYDRFEWHYLQAIMMRLGFSIDFIRLILKRVTSVRFKVCV
jgi:hypothetical protein